MSNWNCMERKLFRLVMAVVAVILAAVCQQADGAAVKHYKTAVDSDCVWQATSEGLMQYDKQVGGFKVYSTEKYRDITSVAVAEDGKVAIGGNANTGLALFDNGVFTPIESGAADLQNISAMEYASGLWVGASHKMLHETQNGWATFDSPSPTAANYSFQTLAWSEKDKRMWFGVSSSSTGMKLGYVDDEGMHFIEESNQNVNSIAVQEDGSVIVATDNGMWICRDGKMDAFETPVSAVAAKCTSVAVNGSMVWYGAETDLVVRGENGKFQKYSYKDADSQAGTDYIVSIVPDKETVWVTFLYAGLMKFEDGEFVKAASGITNITAESDRENDMVYDIRGIKVKDVDSNSRILIRNGKKYITPSR